jgi:MATE family multidrug resistance protein
MLVNVGGTLVNIVLDYCLVFGRFGLPEMGIGGAALATVIANWFNVVMFWLLMQRPADRVQYGLDEGNRLDWPLMRRLIRFGGPSGLPMLVEAGAFTLLTMFVTSLSETAAAATSLAFNVNAVAFIPVYGIGIAVSTLVGQYLGAGKEELAERSTWTALVLAGLYTALFGLLYVGVPEFFLWPHEIGATGKDFAAVKELTIVLLRFVAAYCMFDAMQVIFVGALKGAGDTRFVLLVASVMSVVSIGIGAYGQHYLSWRLLGWWWVMTFWIFALGMIYLARFLQGRWKSMRVIEPELEEVETL